MHTQHIISSVGIENQRPALQRSHARCSASSVKHAKSHVGCQFTCTKAHKSSNSIDERYEATVRALERL